MSLPIKSIIEAIEQAAPLSGQEQWDNSGLLVGCDSAPCTGIMLALDVTPEVVSQAIERGCNLVVSHHPVIFKGLKELNERTPQGQAIIQAVKADVAIYCAHTSLDNAPAPYGVSFEMARMLEVEPLTVISPTGTGVLGLISPMSETELVAKCRDVFTAKGIRTSVPTGRTIKSIALGSGACGFLIPDAIAAGADAIVTSDVRYHDFLDHGNDIFIVDLTHFDTEKCTKQIFKSVISQKFTNFAPIFCAIERNPIEFSNNK